MIKKVPIVSDIRHPRELAQTQDLFARWFALSPLFRLLNVSQLEKIGIDDPAELELLKIRTQKEFAETLKVHEDTLSNWKKKQEFWDKVSEYTRIWGIRKTPSVIAGFYRKAVSEADAPRVKLWLQFFEGFEEKSKVKIVGGSLIGMVRAAEEAEEEAKKKKDAH